MTFWLRVSAGLGKKGQSGASTIADFEPDKEYQFLIMLEPYTIRSRALKSLFSKGVPLWVLRFLPCHHTVSQGSDIDWVNATAFRNGPSAAMRQEYTDKPHRQISTRQQLHLHPWTTFSFCDGVHYQVGTEQHSQVKARNMYRKEVQDGKSEHNACHGAKATEDMSNALKILVSSIPLIRPLFL